MAADFRPEPYAYLTEQYREAVGGEPFDGHTSRLAWRVTPQDFDHIDNACQLRDENGEPIPPVFAGVPFMLLGLPVDVAEDAPSPPCLRPA